MLSDNALHTQSPMPADPSHRAADCMIADLMRQMEEDARRQTAAIEELERLHAASASALWHEERVACDGSALERDCVPLGAHSWCARPSSPPQPALYTGTASGERAGTLLSARPR